MSGRRRSRRPTIAPTSPRKSPAEPRSQPAVRLPPDRVDALVIRLRALAGSTAALVLLAVNLVPVACVVVFHWDIGGLMLVYWAENVVIGIFNVAKMIASGAAHRPWGIVSAVFCVPVFVIHYGLFCLAHGFLLLVMIAVAGGQKFPMPLSVLGDLIRARAGFNVSLAAMVLFYGMDFIFDWLPKGRARQTTPSDLMFDAYPRIGALHLTLMGAMLLILIFGQPLWAVVLLGVAKTVVELARRSRAMSREGASQ